MAKVAKPRVIGFNHVALEVGDIDEALAFYGQLLNSNCVARLNLWPSSTLAISLLPCRKVAGSPQRWSSLWPRRGRQGSCPQGIEDSWCYPD